MHSRIREDLDKAIEASFQSGSYSSYAEANWPPMTNNGMSVKRLN